MILIAPHLDDSVLSCGGMMAAHPGCTSVTVFAGVPDGELPLTSYDLHSGYVAANQAMLARREEDIYACSVLKATPVHLNHLDRQYGVKVPDPEIIESLHEVINARIDHEAGIKPEVFIPLGLVHPDHAQVNRCARVIVKQFGIKPIFYEELPARVLWPDSVKVRSLTLKEFPVGDVSIKRAAVNCYRSQAWAVPLEMCCLVPERFWQ